MCWLAGFTDGEGTITLAVTKRGRARAIHAHYSLTNTDLKNLGRARALLVSLTGHDVQIRPIKAAGRRPAYSIALDAYFDVEVTLQALYRRLVGKWPQASVALEFLRIAPGRTERLNRGGRKRRVTPRGEAVFDERHWALVKRIRELNRRYALGEWKGQEDLLDVGDKAEDWPGYEPMDPLKRWFKLYCG